MKYYGVVHGRTSGYNNEVRKLLGQLKAFLDATNQKFGVRKKLLEDGAEVRVSIIMNGAVPIYKAMVIYPGGIESEPGANVLFMESGFYQVLGRLAAFGAAMWYTAEQLADLEAVVVDPQQPAWIDWLDINPITSAISSTSRVYVAGMESLAIDSAGRLEAVEINNNFGFQSGKTLLLLQAQNGTRAIAKNSYSGATVP